MTKGFPVRTIQHRLGHKSLETTQKYLGIKDDVEPREIDNRRMDRIAEKFKKAGGMTPALSSFFCSAVSGSRKRYHLASCSTLAFSISADVGNCSLIKRPPFGIVSELKRKTQG